MDIEGAYYFQNTPVERVWRAMVDPQIFGRVIPGCERLDTVGEDAYEATVNVGIAAVKGIYTGRVTILDKQPPHSCRIVGEGSGTRGHIRGEGWLTLAEEGGHTVANYRGAAQLAGPIAGVGMRMVSGAARMLANQFFGALADEMNRQVPPAPAAPAQPGAAEFVTTAAPPAPAGPVVQLVRRLRLSDGSPDDERRWARRLVVAGGSLAASLFAGAVLLGWLLGRRRE